MLRTELTRVCQSVMELNGGSVVAMVGKDCVAIACDLRLGNQALTISCNHEKVPVSDRLLRHSGR